MVEIFALKMRVRVGIIALELYNKPNNSLPPPVHACMVAKWWGVWYLGKINVRWIIKVKGFCLCYCCFAKTKM